MARNKSSGDPAVDAIHDLNASVDVIAEDHDARLRRLERGGQSNRGGYGGLNPMIGASGSSLGHALDDDTRAMAQLFDNMGRGRGDVGGFADPEFKAGAASWFAASMRFQLSNGRDSQSAESRDKLGRAFADLGGYQTAAAFTTGTPSLGGDWVPDPVERELRRLVTDNSVLSPLVSHVPMTSKTLDLPVEGSSSLAVSWGTENTNITDSVPSSNALAKITLTANRINGFAIASLESLADSPVSILSWVQQKLTELVGRELDRQALEGTGSPFTGLVGDAGVVSVSSGANGDLLNYGKLASIPFAAVEASSRNGARFFLSPQSMAKLVGLVDSTGQPILHFSNVGGAVTRTLLGYPAEVHSVIKADRTYGTGTTLSNLYFGPPSGIVFGDRMGMAWDVSDAPGFQAVQIAMRLIMREAIGIAVPKAFTRAPNLQVT